VAISAEGERLGIMVHTNNLMREYLGYSRAEVLGHNVKMIMPLIFGEKHDYVLKKYASSAKKKSRGKEMVLSALHKDGHIVPITALIKLAPSLVDGIRIVTFLGQYHEDLSAGNILSVNYLLYRVDTEQIMGISKGLIADCGISPSLVYGHPLQGTQPLYLSHLFGEDFSKDSGSSTARSLEEREVKLTLNTQ
jgi:PAS domain S-box-containing protein